MKEQKPVLEYVHSVLKEWKEKDKEPRADYLGIFNTQATKDVIRHFCDSVGDTNPLWISEEYAKLGRFGMIVAPPTFLYSVDFSISSAYADCGIDMPHTQAFHTGSDWKFFRPIWLGDKFTVKRKFVDVIRKQSWRGPWLFCIGDTFYYNQREELIAVNRATLARWDPVQIIPVEYDREFKVLSPRWPDECVREVERRGAQPLYWEDVEVGMEVTPLYKGLYTMTEAIRFAGQTYGPYRQPAGRQDHLGTGDISSRGHYDPEFGKAVGMPYAYDYGPQRASWLGQLMTDWIGDYGDLRELRCEFRIPNCLGDVNVCKGIVKSKYVQDAEHLVECEIWVENQAGLRTAPGSAVVALPLKKKQE